jgi:hypothetical protein
LDGFTRCRIISIEGLGTYLHNVKYIHTEVLYKEMYTGQVMYSELNEFIVSNGFVSIKPLTFQGWFDDIIYENCNTFANNLDYSTLIKYENKTFSQNGEDGVTMEIIKRLGIQSGFYVEFGTQNGDECNTRILREKTVGVDF